MTQKTKIYDLIKQDGGWVSGYKIEKWAFEIGCKPSTASRRVRELVEDGSIEKRMNGKFVEYRYKGIKYQYEATLAVDIPSKRLPQQDTLIYIPHRKW